MAYNSTYANAVSLSAAARLAYNKINASMPLSRWFPDHSNPNLAWSFDQRVVGDQDIAEYREFDTEGTYGRTFGSAVLKGTLPPIQRKYVVREYDQLVFHTEGQKNAATAAKLSEYSELGAKAIARRLETARIDAVVNGSVDIRENGVAANVDFQRDASLGEVLAGADLWSVGTGDPIGDIEGWMETVRLVSGVIPTYALVSKNVFDTLRLNAKIRALYSAGWASVAPRVPKLELARVLSDEVGLNLVLDMTTAYATSGLEMVNPWPTSTFTLVAEPGPAFGATEFGVVPMATDPQFGVSGADQSGIFARAYDQDNIFSLHVDVEAVALPVMPGVNTVFNATVL